MFWGATNGLGRGEYAVDASAPVNLVAGRVHVGLGAPLQTRRSRRTKPHDQLSVKVPPVQHHPVSGSILAGWRRAESGKGAPSEAPRTPGAHTWGIISLSAGGGWSCDPLPSKTRDKGAPPSRSWGPRGGSCAPLCRAEPVRMGVPLRIPAPTLLFGFISNRAARFWFYLKSWLRLEMIGLCSAPAVLIGSKFLGNLNTGIL